MDDGLRPSKKNELRMAWESAEFKAAPPRGLSPFGLTRRIDIEDMMSRGPIVSQSVAQRVVRTVAETLTDVLSDYGVWWSPSPGVIDVHYGTLSAPAAELKHSIILGALERGIRTRLRDRDAVAASPSTNPHRVDLDVFQQICAKSGARPDQIYPLDVRAILAAETKGTPALTPGVWAKIDAIVDPFLDHGGYVTRQPPNHLLMFFPGLPRSLGESKSKMIARDIAAGMKPQAKETAAKRNAEPVAQRPVRIRSPRQVIMAPLADNSETAAVVRTAPAPPAPPEAPVMEWKHPAMVRDEPWTRMGPDCDVRASELWSSSSRMVCGRVLELVRRINGTWTRAAAQGLPHAEWLDHFVLKRAEGMAASALSRNATSLIVAPVQWHQLDNTTTRNRYLELCAAIPEPVRRLLVLELIGIPDSIIVPRVEERVRQLHRLSRAVICRMRLSGRNLAQLNVPLIYAAGVHLGDEDGEPDIYEAMNRFATICDRLQIKTYVQGVERRRQLLPALAMGAEYLSGAVIPMSQAAHTPLREVSIYELLGTTNDGDHTAARIDPSVDMSAP